VVWDRNTSGLSITTSIDHLSAKLRNGTMTNPRRNTALRLEERDNAEYPWSGGLEKHWLAPNREHYSEFYRFGQIVS
jgi:hypothetical protein